MVSDDEEYRELLRLKQLGLEHLAGKPAELAQALRALTDTRARSEEEGERERMAILRRRAAAADGATAPPPPRVEGQPLHKTSTLVTATRTPGTCTTCRHSNQGTADYEEGSLFCWMAKSPRGESHRCDVTRHLPRRPTDDPSTWSEYHLYEAYDGANCTYERSTDLRMMAEDADEKIKESLRAHIPIEE